MSRRWIGWWPNWPGTSTGRMPPPITSGIDDDAVTYAKIQNVSAASKLLGRGSASGAGDVEEIDYTPAASPGLENYGWSRFEGRARYTDRALSRGRSVPPSARPTSRTGPSGS